MRTRLAVTLTLCLLGQAACKQDESTAPALMHIQLDPALVVEGDTAYADSSEYPEERELRALATRFPGYAGIYFDASRGRLVVAMTDSGQSLRMLDPARQSVHDQVLSGRLALRGNTAPIELRLVPYSYRQLQRWRTAISARLRARCDEHFLLLDVMSNQLVVGTRNPSLVSQLLMAAGKEVVPSGAARVSADVARPLIGRASSPWSLAHPPGRAPRLLNHDRQVALLDPRFVGHPTEVPHVGWLPTPSFNVVCSPPGPTRNVKPNVGASRHTPAASIKQAELRVWS